MTEAVRDAAITNDVGVVPLLTRAREVILFERMTNVDLDVAKMSRECLIRSNMPLAKWLATTLWEKQAGRGVSLEDATQEGYRGLIEAVDRFDYTRGNRFSTYATPWIEKYVKRAIRVQGFTAPHIGEKLYYFAAEVNRAKAGLHGKLGRPPTVAEIARALGSQVETVKDAIRAHELSRAAQLTDTPIEEDGQLALVDTIPAPAYLTIDTYRTRPSTYAYAFEGILDGTEDTTLLLRVVDSDVLAGTLEELEQRARQSVIIEDGESEVAVDGEVLRCFNATIHRRAKKSPPNFSKLAFRPAGQVDRADLKAVIGHGQLSPCLGSPMKKAPDAKRPYRPNFVIVVPEHLRPGPYSRSLEFTEGSGTHDFCNGEQRDGKRHRRHAKISTATLRTVDDDDTEKEEKGENAQWRTAV